MHPTHLRSSCAFLFSCCALVALSISDGDAGSHLSSRGESHGTFILYCIEMCEKENLIKLTPTLLWDIGREQRG
ncbi:hypothetical protein BDQ12DRAFT_690861 [Crucibulum laeve]|uniref:Secreted protein n=1 Tax=Crucibulum laeve TaxID=68775 RepID=A0A5C3LLE2_9AGAR|nr:hypothetical protein BDQ12DRAFT_690861 [Crucibulum laeve]